MFGKKLQKNTVPMRTGIEGALIHIVVILIHLFKQKYRPKNA